MSSGYPFTITHNWIEEDINHVIGATDSLLPSAKNFNVLSSLQDERNDFCVDCPPLSYFYGLSEFIVISPAGNECLETESRIYLILSSIAMAINNTRWYFAIGIGNVLILILFFFLFGCLVLKSCTSLCADTLKVTKALSRCV